jgi:hypothetical protein
VKPSLNKNNDTNTDFLDFQKNNNVPAPSAIKEQLLFKLQKELNPSHVKVFFKLLSIQAFVGFLTMLFCPQFNFSLTNNYELFHFLHHNFGARICMLFCGTIFIGSGATLASYILSLNELNKIKNSSFLYYLSITSIAVTVFIFMGAEVYFNLASFWFIGAVSSGVILLKLNRIIRHQLVSLYTN